MAIPPKPEYARGTNKLQISARELLSFTNQRINNMTAGQITSDRIAAMALRTVQLMSDNIDTKTTDELRDTLDNALPIFRAYANSTIVAVDTDHQRLVLDSITARSQTYENGKMQRHANFCRCLALFLKALEPGKPLGVVEASRAVVKAFYAGADRDKLQHAVMLLF